jgi:hypothetical protein
VPDLSRCGDGARDLRPPSDLVVLQL